MEDNEENRSRVRLYPTGHRFISGIAKEYDDEFPIELEGLMTREDFETCINQINNTLSDYWPCCLCMACGYAFCVCTAGLSLFCPKVCINDAEGYVNALLKRLNHRPVFEKAQIEWKLIKKCGQSFIEISYPHKPVYSKYQDDGGEKKLATSSSYGSWS